MKKVRFNNIAVIAVYLLTLTVLLQIPSMIAPIFKRVFTDTILTENDREWLPALLFMMMATAFLAGAVSFVRSLCLGHVSEKIDAAEKSGYMWELYNAPMHMFDENDSHTLLSQAENAGGRGILIGQALDYLICVISSVFYLIMMFRMNAVMTIIAIVLIAANILISKLIGVFRGSSKTPPNQEELIRRNEQMCSEGLGNIETFKSTASEVFFLKRVIGGKMAVINAQRKEELKCAYSEFEYLPLILFSNLLLLVSAIYIMRLELTIGTYLAFEAYALSLFVPLNQALLGGGALRGLKNSAVSPAEIPNEAEFHIRDKLEGHIEFKNVTFGYHEDKPVIKDFSLQAEPGKWVAVLGRPGSGKTTLLKLLQGLYEPNAGEITIDGQAPLKINRCLYRNSIGCASQEAELFSAPIRQNITMWDKDVTDACIYYAASDACIHDYISTLRDTYDFELSENGRNLSGGQRYLIEITRALLYEPTVVIFDETLRAVDPANRASILSNLRRRGCTFITATHILEKMDEYDEIIVLDGGIVAARGRHADLLQSSPLYASMLKAEGVVAV